MLWPRGLGQVDLTLGATRGCNDELELPSQTFNIGKNGHVSRQLQVLGHQTRRECLNTSTLHKLQSEGFTLMQWPSA